MTDSARKVRRYNCWAGNSHGTPENPALCVVSVPEGGRSVLTRQCTRRRKVGDLCSQHAKSDRSRLWIPEEQ
jgi:hypothetical protein